MDDFLISLQKLVQSKRLQPPERIICDYIINFESVLPEAIDEKLFQDLESLFIHLLSVNEGVLSLRCSIRIGSCLLQLYKTKQMLKSPQNETIQDRSNKTWNLFTEVNKRPTKASIYATGFITKHLGHHATSMIPGFAKKLLSLSKIPHLIQPIIYSLNFCFKKGRREMSDGTFYDNSFKLISKILQTAIFPNSSNINANETLQMLTIRLLRTLISPKSMNKSATSMFPKVFSYLKILLDNNDSISPYVHEEITFLLAKYLLRNLSDCKKDFNSENAETAESSEDFKIANHDQKREEKEKEELSKSLSFLSKEFSNHIHTIFHKILLMISPTYIHKHLDIVFNFIQTQVPEELPFLISLISNDDRHRLFDSLDKLKDCYSSEYLLMMRLLSNDEETINSSAAIAFQMVTKDEDNLKEAALVFFAKLAQKSVDLSRPFVQASTLYLSNPPDIYQKLGREMKGLSLLAATIIIYRPELAYEYQENIRLIIETGLLALYIWESHFQAAVTLMAAIPKISDSDENPFVSLNQIDEALKKYCDFYEGSTSVSPNDNIFPSSKFLASQISMLVCQYPSLSYSQRAFINIYSNDYLQSLAVYACSLKCFSKLVQNKDQFKIVELIGKQLRQLITTFTPPLDFVFSFLKNPILSPHMLVQKNPEIIRDIPQIFLQINSNNFAQNSIVLYPEFISSLPEETAMTFIDILYSSQLKNYSITPCLLLSLLKNSNTAKLLFKAVNEKGKSKDRLDPFLNCLFSALYPESNTIQVNNIPYSQNDFQAVLRIQTLSECIALYTSQHTKFLKFVLDKILKSNIDREKCLLLASIFTYCRDLPDDILITCMVELNSIAQSSEYTAYPYFALMSLFQNYFVQLSSSSFILNQIDFFFDLFQLENSLYPYNMYYMAQSFNSLISIISPTLTSVSLINTTKNVILCFENSEIPFSQNVFYHVLRAVFAFARHFLIKSETDLYSIVKFPTSRGISLSYKSSACGVLSDYAKMINPHIDLFELVPSIFFILQLTNDSRASNFILTLVKNFVINSKGAENELQTRSRLKQWVTLVRLCNSKGVLPGTPDVCAGISVRKVCTSISIELLPLIAASSPIMNDCIDDIIAAVIHSLIKCENEQSFTANMYFQNESFLLLTKIIQTFFNFTDESGKKILELYDSQFSIALKIAFSNSNLSLSGSFLLKLLQFHLNDLSSNEGLLDAYIQGLVNSKQAVVLSHQKNTIPQLIDASYLSIASQLFKVAQNDPFILSKVHNLINDFIQSFSAIVKYAKSIWYCDDSKSKWSEISSFRSLFSEYYSIIVTELIWLSKNDISAINLNDIVDFFSNEIGNCHEIWRISAALSGLTSLIDNQMIQLNDISNVLYSIESSKQVLQTSNFLLFLSSCTEKIKDQDSWKLLFTLYNKSETKPPKPLGYLIEKGDVNDILEQSGIIFTIIIKNFDENTKTLLFTLLFDRIPNKIDSFLNTILSDDHLSGSFKFKMIYRALKRSNCTKSMPLIDNFAVSNCMNGGLELIGFLLILQMKGQLITKFDEDDRFYQLFEVNQLDDKMNSQFAMKILEFGNLILTISEFRTHDRLIASILTFSLTYLSESIEANDTLKSFLSLAAQIWKTINQSDKFMLKIAFKKMQIDRAAKLIETMEKAASSRPKRPLTLKQFSNSSITRNSENNENGWQDL